jgi:hypothetical protein
MEPMQSAAAITLNEPEPAFMKFKSTFDGLRDQGFGSAGPFRMLHEYVSDLQKRTFEIHNSSSFSSSPSIHKDFQDL